MSLNLLIIFSWVVVFVTAIPTIPPSASTTEALEEVDPHIDTENYVFLGSLKSKHSVKYGVYGNVFAVNCTSLFIENFSYSGTGIRVNWVAGQEDEIDKGYPSNIIIPDETGSTERMRRAYSNETFYLNLPNDKTLFGVQWIALLCQSFNLDLGSVVVGYVGLPHNFTTTCENITDGESCDIGHIRGTNDTHELGELLGEFIPTFYSFDYGINGSFYTIINDSQKIYIKDFSYNGNAPSVFIYVGLTHNTGVNNFYVPRDYHYYNPCNITDGFIIGELSEGQPKVFGQNSLSKYEEQSMLLNLPGNYTIYNIRWIMVWCYVFALDMGHASNTHFIEPPSVEYRKKRELDEMDMILLGTIDGKKFDVKGMVYAINSTTLFLSGFSYNGESPDAYFFAGSTEKIGKIGFRIPDENGSEDVLNVYENQNFTLSLPDGKRLKDMKWLSIFCDSFLEDLGHTRFDGETLDKFDVNASSVYPLDEAISSDHQNETIENSENMKELNMSKSENIKESDMSKSDNMKEMNMSKSGNMKEMNMSASENMKEMNMSTSENMKESNMSQEVEPEKEPESVPEPGDYGTRARPRTSESKGGSKGMESLTTTSYHLSIITLGLCFLFR